MYGHHVHEAVMQAFWRGEITHTEINMHFVSEEYDKGPVFFRCIIPIQKNDTPDTLAARVNVLEHYYQPIITNLVVSHRIRWNGIDPGSLVTPQGKGKCMVFYE